eukprot:7484443-Lingulodinium_polyedra.AAC.1
MSIARCVICFAVLPVTRAAGRVTDEGKAAGDSYQIRSMVSRPPPAVRRAPSISSARRPGVRVA